nr:alpha/beta hydrolase [uncultured Pedobacter sp.]
MRNRLIIIFLLIAGSVCAQNHPIELKLWKNEMPNQLAKKEAGKIKVDSSKNIIKVTEVTDPLIAVYRPKTKSNKATVIINPGGGQKYLSWNLEGTEIADWLTNLGYTAVVLQYRVPNNQVGALNDLHRAIKMMRYNALKFNIDTNKIGVIGFSAGGNLSARAATGFKLTLGALNDDIDKISSRPNFALLVYPGSMSTGEDRHLIPQIPVDADTPPVFIFVASDDPYNIPFSMGMALRANKIPFEFHVVPKGGHGYGLRKGNPAAEAWPSLAESWLNNILNLNND